MARQLGRLYIRVDGSKVGRLPSNRTAVLLLHGGATTKDNGLGTLQFVHSDLIHLGQKRRSGKSLKAKETTYREQGAGRGATAVPNDSYHLWVKQSLARGVEMERLTLLT
jgi:hypothetical protein